MGERLLPRTLAAIVAIIAGLVASVSLINLVDWLAGDTLHGWRALVADLASVLLLFDVAELTYRKIR